MTKIDDPIGDLVWERKYIEDAIPLHELVPKGMTIKEIGRASCRERV